MFKKFIQSNKIALLVTQILLVQVLTIFSIPASDAAVIPTANGCSNFEIAYQGPLTGPFSDLGQNQLRAVKLALSDVKNKYSDFPTNLSILEKDDQGDPAIASTVSANAASRNCLLGVIGPAFSGAGRQSIPNYYSAGIPVISPSASNSILSQSGPGIFHSLATPTDFAIKQSVTENNYQHGYVVADVYSATHLLGSNTNLIALNDAGSVVSESLTAAIQNNADAIYYSGYMIDTASVQNFANFRTQLTALGYTGALYLTDYADLDLIKGLNLTSLNNIKMIYPYAPVSKYGSAFTSRFKSLNSADPQIYAAEAYDAAMLMLEGIYSGAHIRSDLVAYLNSHSINGVSGYVSFRSDGFRSWQKIPTYNITVSGGVASLNIVQATDPGLNGNLEIATYAQTIVETSTAVNFHVSLKDQSGNPVTGYITFCGATGCDQINVFNGSGSGHIADGVYKRIEVSSTTDTSLATIFTSGTFANNVGTFSQVTKTGDTYNFVLPPANLKALILNPLDSQTVNYGYVNVFTSNSNWTRSNFVSSYALTLGTSGDLRSNLADGRYIIDIGVDTRKVENAGITNKQYRVQVTSGVVTVYSESTQILATNGIFQLTPAIANLKLSIKNPDGTDVSYSYFEVFQNLNGQQGNWISSGDMLAGYLGYAALPDGEFLITVYPPEDSVNSASKTYSLTVASGIPNILNAEKISDTWILRTASPNFSGSIYFNGSPISMSQNQGVYLDIQKIDIQGNWNYIGGGRYFTSANFAFNFTSAGKYRLQANPEGFTEYVATESDPFWVNAQGKLSRSETGTYVDSLTAFNITLKTPNFRAVVKNPNNSQPLDSGWIGIQKVNGQNFDWIGSANIQFNNPGLASYYFANTGEYILTVNPPNGGDSVVGLAPQQYRLNVYSTESMTVTLNGNSVLVENGKWILSPAAANVTARVMLANGSPATPARDIWYNANLQKYNSAKSFWEWIGNGVNTNNDGYVSMRFESAGKYRLRIQPNGNPDAAVTYSQEFTVTEQEVSTFKKEFGNIVLRGPALKVSVSTISDPSSPITNTNVQVRKNGNWIDWIYISNSGVAGINFDSEGAYELIVYPNNNLQGITANKSYKVTATKNSDGTISATIDSATGASIINGVNFLQLAAPTLSGTVKDPSGTTTQSNSQVYAQNVATGQDMWEYSTQSNQSGAWSMLLPAGTYKIIARAPWGTANYGNSDAIGNVVVDASGTATSVPGGYSANSFNIRLKNPTWSGTIKTPSGVVVPDARICIRLSNIFYCNNADSQGRWALSAPTGFTTFTGTNPYLEINDDNGRVWPQRRWDGESAVNTALGGTTNTGINLAFSEPNVRLTIMAGDTPAPNVWVWIDRDVDGWLGGSSTDGNGVAKFNLTSLASGFRVHIEVNGNQQLSSTYAGTLKTYTTTQVVDSTTAGSGTFIATIPLALPNFTFSVREPSAQDGTAGALVPWTWVELYSESTGQWMGGSSTDANGMAALKLDVPNTGFNNYTVTVNPAWNSTTLYSRQAYLVAVQANGAITVVNKTTNDAVATTNISGKTAYPLTLANPSISGVVVDPTNNTVANSWVVPIDNASGEWYWKQATNSRNDGQFGLNVPAGQYKLEANVPWGMSGVAKSARCLVTVVSGTISTGGDCVQGTTNKTVKLQLRSPNLTFTLKIDGVAIPNANVGIGSGSWWTNAQSDSQGIVSIFVDADAVRASNSGSGTRPLYVWVDPPYGSSTMARWNCSAGEAKPICSALQEVPVAGDYPTLNLGNIEGVKPNTRIKIVIPGTSTELPGSWVNVMAINPSHPNNGQWWLNGGTSGSDGYAVFNLETTTAANYGYTRYIVEVNAPWNLKTSYTTKTFNGSGTGYTWAELQALTSLEPATPNLTLGVMAYGQTSANKWGWVSVEQVNDSYQSIKWIVGSSLNENGAGAVYLAGSSKFKLTFYPGGGRSGAATTCYLSTSSDSTPVVSRITDKCSAGSISSGNLALTLDGGNVVGNVTRASNGSAVVGAIVYANYGSADDSTAVITTTDENGRYGLQLDTSKLWKIKVFPIAVGNETLQNSSESTVTFSAGAATINVSISGS